jgi:hypothetical protein
VNYQYVIVFNTSGNGGFPYPNAYLTGFTNYSYSLVFNAQSGTPSPLFYQFYLNPTSNNGLQRYQRTIPVQSLNFEPNDSGTGNELQVTFNRLLFNQTSPVATAAPATSAPTASPSASPTATAIASTTPGPLQTTPAQDVWTINFFVLDQFGNPVDSMGSGGANDTTFQLGVDTTQAQDLPYTKPAGSALPPSPNAQLAGYTIINTP